jgi:hypothetical protein
MTLRAIATATLAFLPLLSSAAVPARAAAPAIPVPDVPGELRGQVTRFDGTPVTRFTVNGVRFEDTTGAFHILVPPEGEFRIVVRADGLAPNIVHVMGAAGKKLSIPEIMLGGGEDVIGDVLDAETGMPIVNARVGLADPHKVERLRFVRPERLGELASTGSGGAFLIRKAPRGLLMLVVHQEGYLTEFVPVNTRGQIPSILLHRAGRIAGVVQDTAGKPVPGARVVAVSQASIDGGETVADAHGEFEIPSLRPGNYQVSASVGNSPPAPAPAAVPVRDGATATVQIQVRMKVKAIEIPEIQLGVEEPDPAERPMLAASR